jgi:AcrR family transcriptional regulator
MLPPGEPKFKRRKADRPDEIVAAAFQVFGEKGFAAARLDDIAARAGVSKGAIYLYFATKEDVFRAVVEQGIEPHLRTVQASLTLQSQPLPDLLRSLAPFMSQMINETPVGGIIKVVIGEARNFPELARIWHDRLIAVALGTLTGVIAAAQARGPRVLARPDAQVGHQDVAGPDVLQGFLQQMGVAVALAGQLVTQKAGFRPAHMRITALPGRLQQPGRGFATGCTKQRQRRVSVRL